MHSSVPVPLAAAALMLCTLGAGSVRAQAPTPTPPSTPPKAYYIADFEPTVPGAIRPYSEQVDATFKAFGGRYIVRAGTVKPLEGDPPRGRLIVIEFDSMERAQSWYDSPAYRQLRPIRQGAGNSRTFIIEGTAP